MSVKHFTNSAAFDSAIQTAPVAMVDFWATWGGPCKMLAPTIEKIGESYEGKALIAKVDVDQCQDLAARFGIMSIPTVVFFQNGKEVGRRVGVQPPAAFTGALDQLL